MTSATHPAMDTTRKCVSDETAWRRVYCGLSDILTGGGHHFFGVYLSGTENNVDSYVASSSSSSGSATTPAPTSSSTAQAAVSTSVAPGTTVVVTMPSSQQQTEAPSPSAEADSDSGSKPNVAGIAAGVVVGVVAVAGIAIGLFFFMRHRKQKAAEEEYKRNQVSDFMRHGGTSGEGKPPNTGYSNMSDQRLDPEAGRRNSAGSIADDQDYSRRILRVSDAFFFVSNHSLANSSTRSPTPRKRLSFSLSPQASTERSGFVFIEENGHERWCHQRKNIQNKKPAPRKPKSNLPISPPQPPQKRSPSRLSKQRERRDDSSTTVPKKEEHTSSLSFFTKDRKAPTTLLLRERRRGSTDFPCFFTLLLAFFPFC